MKKAGLLLALPSPLAIDCRAEVAAAQSFIDSHPADPACGDAGPPRIRVVSAPDPLFEILRRTRGRSPDHHLA